MSEKPYVNKKGVNIRVSTDKREKVHVDVYDKDPSKDGKESIHVNVDTKTGKGTIVEKSSSGEKTTTPTQCYLTTACMKHYLNNFDDNCYELTVLRWFRDNCVSKEDITHYYNVAPYIVYGIEKEDNKDIIYDYIYDNIVDYCVTQIENGNLKEAYKRYQESILHLEELYARRELHNKLIKVLNK